MRLRPCFLFVLFMTTERNFAQAIDADAVIVGSALVSAVENGLGAVRSLTEELAEGVRSATVAS